MNFDLSLLSNNEKEMTEVFLELQNHTCGGSGVVVESIQQKEPSLKLAFEGKRLKLYWQQQTQFYRGLHLFLQEIKNGNTKPLQIEEKCCFNETGLMIDCSRNGTVSLDMLREFVRLCAACGLSQLYLYMEDVYEIPEEPYFGAYRGKYTYDELRKLDEYGRKCGVELIPAIQTLAHLHTYLRWPKTKKIQDTEDILLVGSEDTEVFVRQMIQNASRAFSTKKIHVGMDEADQLGLGQYLRMHGYEDRYGIMMKHMGMVHRICKEEGLEAMLWSDMFFRLISPTGDYHDLPEDTDFHLPNPIPKELTLVYWDYYQHEKAMYDKNIMLHQKLTNQIRFAGGGWTWNGISPNYSKAEKTLQEGLASCKDQGIDKVMCTFWFDNGTETPVRTAFYSAVYFAQLCYHSEADIESLDRWLEQLTGYPAEAYKLLDAFDNTIGTLPENRNGDNPSKYLLYQDILTGLFDGQIEHLEMDVHYQKLAEKLQLLPEKNKKMDEVFSYYRKLANLLKEKSMLGVKLRKAYQAEDTKELKRLVEVIKGCISAVRELKEQRKKIWYSECRPFGFEVLDIRLGGIGVRMESAVERMESYLRGEIDKLEELEEKMLIYYEDTSNEEHKLCAGGFWQNIVSGGNISGI